MSDQSYPSEILNRIQKLKAVLFDVDGVLTDGKIIINSRGGENKNFNVHDGLGIFYARTAGFIAGIITGRASKATKIRAKELGIDFLSQGCKNKREPYEAFKRQFTITDEEICYVGDDLLDLPVMAVCGFAVSVANGREEVKTAAHYITRESGGNGAVREVIEFILKQQGKWHSIVSTYYGTETK